MAATATILARGDTLAGYRVLDVIGMGGMAIVYLAEQLSLGRPVALKVLAPQLANDADFRERFRREGKHAAKLDHPHVVTIHDSGEHEGRLYMAMRLVQGTTLADDLINGGLGADETIALLAPIADALDAAHELDLIHRDVKPQNILIAANGHSYLADFGIARATTTTAGLTATGGFVGSINYAAPEQITGRPASAAGDIYALCAVLYQCFTGEVPFPRDTDAGVMHAHLHSPPPRLGRPSSEVGELNRVIAKGMAKDPAHRYARASDLLTDAANAIAALPRTGGAPLRLEAQPDVDQAPPVRRERNGARAAAADAGARPDWNPEHTEALSADERVRPRRVSEATSYDQRRGPVPVAEVAPPTLRRRWPRVAAAGALLVATVGVVVVLLSGGEDVAAPEIATSNELSVSFSAPWRRTTVASAASRVLTSPVLLAGEQTTFAAGRLARSPAVPGAAPPALVAQFGKPSSSARVTLATLPATRHTWTADGRPLVVITLARASTDLAIVCTTAAQQAPTVAPCAALASAVEVTGDRIVAAGADPVVARRLRVELGPVAQARSKLAALGAGSLPARASRADALNELEARQLKSLTTVVARERNRAAVAALTGALGTEAEAWADLARAARSNRRTGYTTARAALIAAGRQVAAASSALKRQGFTFTSLRSLTIPAAPAIAKPKAPSPDEPSGSGNAPQTPTPTPTDPTPTPKPTPKKPQGTQFGPTEKEKL